MELGDSVTRLSTRHWVWRCPLCEGPDDMTNSAHVDMGEDSPDPKHPDFAKRYEGPALRAFAFKAEAHMRSIHPGVDINAPKSDKGRVETRPSPASDEPRLT